MMTGLNQEKLTCDAHWPEFNQKSIMWDIVSKSLGKSIDSREIQVNNFIWCPWTDDYGHGLGKLTTVGEQTFYKGKKTEKKQRLWDEVNDFIIKKDFRKRVLEGEAPVAYLNCIYVHNSLRAQQIH